MESTTQRLMLMLGQLGDTQDERKIARGLQLELDHLRFQMVCDKIDKLTAAMKDSKPRRSLKEVVAPWLPLASIIGLLVAQVPLKDVALLAAKAFLK